MKDIVDKINSEIRKRQRNSNLKLTGMSSAAKYQPSSSMFSFYVIYNHVYLINKFFDPRNHTNFEDWCLDLWKESALKVDELNKSLNDFKNSLNDIKITPHKFKFENFKTGICAYPSLGKQRWAWIALRAHNTHDVWLKCYFSEKGILWKWIKKNIKTLRKNEAVDWNWSKFPPLVPILKEKHQNIGFEFIEENEEEILKAVRELPLNSTKFREDYNYDVYIATKNQHGNLKPITAGSGTLASPNSELWMVVKINGYNANRTYCGWAKQMSGDKISVLTECMSKDNPGEKTYYYSNDIDKSSIIKGGSYLQVLKFKEEAQDRDEVIAYLLDKSIKEFVNTNSGEK